MTTISYDDDDDYLALKLEPSPSLHTLHPPLDIGVNRPRTADSYTSMDMGVVDDPQSDAICTYEREISVQQLE